MHWIFLLDLVPLPLLPFNNGILKLFPMILMEVHLTELIGLVLIHSGLDLWMIFSCLVKVVLEPPTLLVPMMLLLNMI